MSCRGEPLGAWQALVAALIGLFALPVCAASPTSLRLPESTQSATQRFAPAEPAAPTGTGVKVSKTVERRPGESLQQLAARILPAGAETIDKPVELRLPPLGKVIVILYQNASEDPSVVRDPSVYRGWILIPAASPSSYRVEPLPSLTDGAATLMYQVKSVFAADVDRDGASELCILSEITEVGAGDRGTPHTDTDLFKWSGTHFAVIKQGDRRPLYNLRDVKAVRARLKTRAAH